MRSVASLYNSATNRLANAIANSRDFRTKRHIVVFESDDWGSIRMCDRKGWEELRAQGYAVDKRPYERFDLLESPTDLEALFDVLCRYKDSQGRHPIITANMLVANPDFEKIAQSGYQSYYYEPICDTYKRYYGDDKVLELMRQGISEGVFMPQSHGREHFNVAQWMTALQSGDEDVLTAFRYGMCGIAPKIHPEQGNQMMVALRSLDAETEKQALSIVSEGLDLFEQLWGFRSKTFIAPCYTWNADIENILQKGGVKLLQSGRVMRSSTGNKGKYSFVGQYNKCGQLYNVRNCTFEPSTIENDVCIERLLKQVDNAFAHHKIATFSTHRINYVGGLFEENRTRNLILLDQFLSELLSKYPDVEFMNSEDLISII